MDIRVHKTNMFESVMIGNTEKKLELVEITIAGKTTKYLFDESTKDYFPFKVDKLAAEKEAKSKIGEPSYNPVKYDLASKSYIADGIEIDHKITWLDAQHDEAIGVHNIERENGVKQIAFVSWTFRAGEKMNYVPHANGCMIINSKNLDNFKVLINS
jgi:hypothetical protein